MGLAFDAIEPVIYPIAYELFEKGMERHWVAGQIFKKFGKIYNSPEDELSTAMIDLSISCAEEDYKKSVKSNTNVKQIKDI